MVEVAKIGFMNPVGVKLSIAIFDLSNFFCKRFPERKKMGSHFFMGLKVPSLDFSFKKLGWESFFSFSVGIVVLRSKILVEGKSALQTHDYGLCLCKARVISDMRSEERTQFT